MWISRGQFVRSFLTVVLWSIRSLHGEGVCYQVVSSWRIIKETLADTKAIRITQWAPLTSPVSPESMLQAPNLQRALGTRAKRGQWDVRKPPSVAPQSSSRDGMSAERNHMLRFPKGLRASCFRGTRCVTEGPSDWEQSTMQTLRTAGKAWASSLWPCDLQRPRGPTSKVTKWLKSWSLSFIYARVRTFFSLKKRVCEHVCVASAVLPQNLFHRKIPNSFYGYYF